MCKTPLKMTRLGLNWKSINFEASFTSMRHIKLRLHHICGHDGNSIGPSCHLDIIFYRIESTQNLLKCQQRINSWSVNASAAAATMSTMNYRQKTE